MRMPLRNRPSSLLRLFQSLPWKPDLSSGNSQDWDFVLSSNERVMFHSFAIETKLTYEFFCRQIDDGAVAARR